MAQPEIIREDAFARRLTQICESHPLCPRDGKGRLGWIQKSMADRGAPTSIESVRKWLKGVNKPNRKSMTTIAAVFGVDPAWLTHGRSPSDQDDILPLAKTNGATGVVGGFMKLAGLEPFFMDDGEDADMEVIHRNRRYRVSVALAHVSDGNFVFRFPARYEDITLVGFIPTGSIACSLIKFSTDEIATHAVSQGPTVKLTINKEGRVDGFSKKVGRFIVDIKQDLLV